MCVFPLFDCPFAQVLDGGHSAAVLHVHPGQVQGHVPRVPAERAGGQLGDRLHQHAVVDAKGHAHAAKPRLPRRPAPRRHDAAKATRRPQQVQERDAQRPPRHRRGLSVRFFSFWLLVTIDAITMHLRRWVSAALHFTHFFFLAPTPFWSAALLLPYSSFPLLLSLSFFLLLSLFPFPLLFCFSSPLTFFSIFLSLFPAASTSPLWTW